MKVVINTCHGGFGLSTEAMKRAIAEGAAGIEVYDEQEYNGDKERGSSHYVGGGYEVGSISGVLYKDGKVYRYDNHREEARSDPALVRIVEEMGTAANGHAAELRVVEVTDDVEWEIRESGGKEYIKEWW